MVLMTSRRSFMGSALSLLAAPAIVKIASIMPVKSLDGVSLTSMAHPDELLTQCSDYYLFGFGDWRGIYGARW